MPIKQTDRLIRIDTPLDPDTFVVLSFSGKEQISELFGYELQLASKKNDIRFDQLAGKNVTVSIHACDATQRYFNGIIVEFSPSVISEQDDYCVYSALMLPAVWTLKQCYDCRIFQNKTVPDIIREVLSPPVLSAKQVQQTIAHRMELSGAYLPREYCVQYNESDFDFIARLCEEEGICYFFDHQDGQHTLIFADSPDKHPPCAGQTGISFQRTLGGVLEKDVISSLQQNNKLASAQFVARDFNFKIPHNDLTVQQTAMQNNAHDVGERYEYPGGYKKTHDQGQNIVVVRIQERDARVSTILGKSNCRKFTAGFRFTLEKYPITSMNGKDYLLLSLGHKASQGFGTGGHGDKYENQFVCMAHQTPFRPPRKTPKPVISGVQTAMVTGPAGEEIHTDEHGRVKVQFHWDRLGNKDDHSSCWIRVSQGWAGSSWGGIYIPRIGQEVIVDFLEGNPDEPIITGRVYNGANMSPYPLPAEKTKSTLISSSTPGGNGSNELRFEDKAGNEEIYLHGQKDWNIAIENDKSETIGNNETIDVGVNRTKSVGTDQKESIGRNKTIQVGKYHHETIGRQMTIHVGPGYTMKIGQNVKASITGNQRMTTGGNTNTTSGSTAETVIMAKALTVGGVYQVSVGAAMNETVVGLKAEEVGTSKVVMVKDNFTETVGKTHKLKAERVEIEAEEEVILKTKTEAGYACIEITKDGRITLRGTKVDFAEPIPIASSSYTISATAGPNGTISFNKVTRNEAGAEGENEMVILGSDTPNGAGAQSGSVTLNKGESQIFFITPNDGYQVEDVVVDDESQGAVNSYTFSDISGSHTIAATFVDAWYSIEDEEDEA